jgi:hypothetical protein
VIVTVMLDVSMRLAFLHASSFAESTAPEESSDLQKHNICSAEIQESFHDLMRAGTSAAFTLYLAMALS